MAGFKKAKAEQAALKIGLYGPPGSGKTFTALLLAEGLSKHFKKRVAYVDTERGTDFYCKDVPDRKIHPKAFDFDAIYTRSLAEILRETKALDANQYGVLIIDSITHLWEAAKAAYAGKLNRAGQIPFQAWTNIKRPYKDLVSFLLSSPMHVILCGREGNNFEEDEETGELKMVGKKMKAEGETAYEPHILLRMEAMRTKSHSETIVTAFAEKDRTGVLSGKTIQSPSYENIVVPLLGLLGEKQARVDTAEDTGMVDAEEFERLDKEREITGAEIYRRMCARIELCEDAESLKALGAEITVDMKRSMTTDQVASLREKYLERETLVKGVPSKPKSRTEEGAATATANTGITVEVKPVAEPAKRGRPKKEKAEEKPPAQVEQATPTPPQEKEPVQPKPEASDDLNFKCKKCGSINADGTTCSKCGGTSFTAISAKTGAPLKDATPEAEPAPEAPEPEAKPEAKPVEEAPPPADDDVFGLDEGAEDERQKKIAAVKKLADDIDNLKDKGLRERLIEIHKVVGGWDVFLPALRQMPGYGDVENKDAGKQAIKDMSDLKLRQLAREVLKVMEE